MLLVSAEVFKRVWMGLLGGSSVQFSRVILETGSDVKASLCKVNL